MFVPAPDPAQARVGSLAELHRRHLPLPPADLRLLWAPDDLVDLRPRDGLEGRAAILTVLVARGGGMPSRDAMSWLLAGRLLERLTPSEWRYIAAGQGDPRVFAGQGEALTALGWLLGLVPALDPATPATGDLYGLFPDLRGGESYDGWRARTLTAVRSPVDAAVQLDRYFCLDWAFLAAQRRDLPLPGLIDVTGVGQRRWALEWAVRFRPAGAAPTTGPPR